MEKRKIKTKILDENERIVITNPEKIDFINKLINKADSMKPSPKKSKEIDEYIENGGYYMTADEWDAL